MLYTVYHRATSYLLLAAYWKDPARLNPHSHLTKSRFSLTPRLTVWMHLYTYVALALGAFVLAD